MFNSLTTIWLTVQYKLCAAAGLISGGRLGEVNEIFDISARIGPIAMVCARWYGRRRALPSYSPV